MLNPREDWPEIRPRPHLGSCPCRSCRGRSADRYVERLASQSLSTALRHAQDPGEAAHEATRPSEMSVGPIGPIAWSAPVSVYDIVNRRAPKDFETKGRYRVYRITRDGKELYVAGVWSPTKSVADRIREHHDGGVIETKLRTSEQHNIRKLIKQVPTRTMVRYADVIAPPGHRAGPKLTHAVELLLATKIKPQIYMPNVVSFEDDLDAP